MELKYTEPKGILNKGTFGENTVSMLMYGVIDGDFSVHNNIINSADFVREMNFHSRGWIML